MNARPTLFALAFAITTFALAPQAHALDCGEHTVVAGDTAAQLVEACGSPTGRDTRRTARARHSRSAASETWIYDFGSRRDRIAVTIRNGRILAFRAIGPGTPH